MDTVYKYCGKHGLTILRSLELLVRPPNQFNDPFEFTPKMICADPVRYLKSEIVCRWWYEVTLSRKKFSGSFSEFKVKYLHRVDENMHQSATAIAEVIQVTLPFVEKTFLDEVSKWFGILCMSKRRDSILMWGHYCDKPSGLVIGFDKSSGIFQQEKGLQPVEYVKERVVFDTCWENRTPEMDSYNHKLVFSKSDAWSYEEELRQFFWLSKLKPELLEDGTIGHFLSFPAEAIVNITLGPRCSPELERDVRETLLKPAFPNVKLDRAVLSKNDFTIEFEPVESTP